jgi:hypothetical protein
MRSRVRIISKRQRLKFILFPYRTDYRNITHCCHTIPSWFVGAITPAKWHIKTHFKNDRRIVGMSGLQLRSRDALKILRKWDPSKRSVLNSIVCVCHRDALVAASANRLKEGHRRRSESPQSFLPELLINKGSVRHAMRVSRLYFRRTRINGASP